MACHHLKKVVGNTPLFPITRVWKRPDISILAKLEWMQIGGSVKSRPAFNIIREALQSGALHRDRILLDASSGNTAISYAALGAALGIKVTVCLPENASQERVDILKAFGASLIFTSRFGGTDEAQIKARELKNAQPHLYYYADQYNNPNNWKAHYYGTAEEIFRQTKGLITHLVVAIGTTGTAMGTAKRLKELNPEIKLITLQPDVALHSLEGWKHLETAIVPGIYQPSLADENLYIDSGQALHMVKEIARKEGMLVSPSSAGNLLGAIKVAERMDEGVIVTLFPDNADKYSEVLKTIF